MLQPTEQDHHSEGSEWHNYRNQNVFQPFRRPWRRTERLLEKKSDIIVFFRIFFANAKKSQRKYLPAARYACLLELMQKSANSEWHAFAVTALTVTLAP